MEKKKYIVYIIRNKKNGKCYVGQTCYSLEHRWKRHLSSARQGSSLQFHQAIRKHGVYCWDKKVVYETVCYRDVCEVEKNLILENKSNTFKFGYNSALGGTGGWVVKKENYDKWLENQKLKSYKYNNGNWGGLTDEELVDIVIKLTKELGYIPTRSVVIKRYNNFPKTFSKNRFKGSYLNLTKIVEEESGLIYNPYRRSDEQRKYLREKMSGRIWVTNGKQRKQILPEELEDYIGKGFKRGKK